MSVGLTVSVPSLAVSSVSVPCLSNSFVSAHLFILCVCALLTQFLCFCAFVYPLCLSLSLGCISYDATQRTRAVLHCTPASSPYPGTRIFMPNPARHRTAKCAPIAIQRASSTANNHLQCVRTHFLPSYPTRSGYCDVRNTRLLVSCYAQYQYCHLNYASANKTASNIVGHNIHTIRCTILC